MNCHVLRPRGATTVAYGEEIALSAVSTYGPGYGETIWSSDRDGDLGTGGYQVVRLSPGRHLLTVRRGPYGERVPGAVVEGYRSMIRLRRASLIERGISEHPAGDCGLCYADNEEPRLYIRIVTSPAYGKALLEILRNSLEQYEKTYGPVGE